MASNKIQWEGKIPDSDASWISFSDQTKNGYEYDDGRKSITASTSSNNGQVPDDITFDLKENNTASPRNTTVVFTQQGTGLKAYYNVQQKVGHVRIYDPTKYKVTKYEENVDVTPDGDSIDYTTTTQQFKAIYTCSETTIPAYYFADDPSNIKYDSNSATTKQIDNNTNNTDFTWESVDNSCSVDNYGKATFTENSDKSQTKTIKVKATYKNHKKASVDYTIEGSYSDTGYVTQQVNGDVIGYVFTADSPSLRWNWDDSSSSTAQTIAITSYSTKNGNKDKDLDYDITDISSTAFTITNNGNNTITCYPNAQNTDATSQNTFTLTLIQKKSNKTLTISLTQGTNTTEYYAYKFEVQPREAIWESSQYGENVESAFTITSKYAKYKYGETPSDSDYTNDCQYILDPQPSTMKAFSYELTNQKILTYPKGENDSLSQNIISAVTITQRNFNNSGNSTESPITIKLIQKPQNTTPPFDYMVLKYYWTDDDGKDLDTATYIQGTNDKNIDEHYVGYDLGYSNKYITHAGDNTTSGYETLYIDMPSIINTITADTSNNVRNFDVCALGNWYKTKKNGNIKCSVKLYKGGTMSRKSDDSSSIDYYEFVNNGGEDVTPSNGLTLSKKVNASGGYIHNAGNENYVDEFYTTLFKINYSIDTKSATISDWNDNEGHIINGNFGRTIQIQSSGYTNEENISPSLNVDGNDMDLQCKSVISYSLTYYSGTTSISNPNWGETVTDVQIKNNKISYTITIPENKENFKKKFDINFYILMAYSNGKEFNGFIGIEYYQEPSS